MMTKTAQMAAAVQGWVTRSIAPLIERVKALEDRPAPERGEKGDRGESGAKGLDGAQGARGEPGPMGGKGDPGDRGPAGERGVDGLPGKDGAPGERGPIGERGEKGLDGAAGLPGQKGADGTHGRDGRDVDQAAVEALIERRAAEMVAEMLPALVEKHVAARLDSVSAEWQAKTALLVPSGRDGLPGAPGRPGTPGENGIDGKDGAHGRDGRDGFTLDDLEIELKGRTLTLALRTADRTVTREVTLPGLPIYRGVVKSGQKDFEAGDVYTWSGSLWVVKRDTDKPPPGDDWQMCVKGVK